MSLILGELKTKGTKQAETWTVPSWKSKFLDLDYSLGLGLEFFSMFPENFGVRTSALDSIPGPCPLYLRFR